MKTRFFTFLTICIFTAMQSKAGDGMSFNGQNGRDPKARNTTLTEHIGLILHGHTIDGLAYYPETPQNVMQDNVGVVKKVGQEILFKQLNAINSQTKELWLDNGRLVPIPDTLAVEEILKAYVTMEVLDPNKEYTFYSLDNSFNGKYGEIPRKPYFPGEQGAFLTTPITHKKFLLWDAACSNPAKIETMGGAGGLGGGGHFEKFGDSNGGLTVNVYAYGGNVENSGNSTVTTAAPVAAQGDAYFPGLTEERPTEREATTTSTTKTTTTTSTSDDVPAPGGATATSESNSKTINISMFNGNSVAYKNGNGGGSVPYGGGGSYWPREYCREVILPTQSGSTFIPITGDGVAGQTGFTPITGYGYR